MVYTHPLTECDPQAPTTSCESVTPVGTNHPVIHRPPTRTSPSKKKKTFSQEITPEMRALRKINLPATTAAAKCRRVEISYQTRGRPCRRGSDWMDLRLGNRGVYTHREKVVPPRSRVSTGKGRSKCHGTFDLRSGDLIKQCELSLFRRSRSINKSLHFYFQSICIVFDSAV